METNEEDDGLGMINNVGRTPAGRPECELTEPAL